MLKLKINNTNASITYTELAVNNLYLRDIDKKNIVVTSKSHNMWTGDTVKFERNDGEYISFVDYKQIEKIDNDNFDCGVFKDIILKCDDVDIILMKEHPSDLKESAFLRFMCYDEPHIFCENRDNIKPRHYFSDNDLLDSGFTFNKMCIGDYVIYNNAFLYVANDIENDFYVLDKTMYNIHNVILKIKLSSNFGNGNNLKDILLNTDYSYLNRNIGYNDEYMYLTNCIVPFTYKNDGIDNRNVLLFKFNNDNEIERLIANHIVNYYKQENISYNDERFFKIEYNDNNTYHISLKNNTKLYKRNGDFRIELGLGETFATDLYKQELYNGSLLENIKKESINPIIDYEKQIFSPVFINTDDDLEIDGGVINITNKTFADIESSFLPVNRIEFNLNFRERNDYESWTINDTGYWNNFIKDDSGNGLKINEDYTKPEASPNHSDLLYFAGFNDDDVHFQKMALQQSFIRLSFYDNPNRGKQVLQYYSTIFLDTNLLFANYTRLLNDDEISNNNDNKDKLVIYNTIDPLKQLRMKFFSTDKFDSSSSSDGLYLYLYDSLLNGNLFTPLYMKVEFNNAKYGRTVPFIMPVNDKYEPILPTDEGFPISYDNIDKTGTDMQRLLKDMYIKIYIKYDVSRRQFVWLLPRKRSQQNNSTMIFNLYEPKLNDI